MTISNEVLAQKIDDMKELLVDKIAENAKDINEVKVDYNKFKFKTIADITCLQGKVSYKIALVAALPGAAAAIFVLLKYLKNGI